MLEDTWSTFTDRALKVERAYGELNLNGHAIKYEIE